MNLSSPLFDIVRIPPRETASVIAERLCRESGLDPAIVRAGPLPGKGAQKGVYELRCRIVCALLDANYVTGTWFEGIPPETIRRYGTHGRRMARQAA
jgi:hypothetical protein